MITPKATAKAPGEHRGAIMQPTYLPWIGYFALMQEVDTFVILDSVQFQKHSWQQRNRIKTANGIQWLTVPVLTKGRLHQTIAEAEINPSEDFRRRHIKSIEVAYHKSPYFSAYAPAIFEIIARPHKYLVDLTIDLIQHFVALLEISCTILRSRDLAVEGHKAELLAEICARVGINHYISPPGSAAYLARDATLERRGLRLTYSCYRPCTYPQPHGDFFPLTSLIDGLFSLGPDTRRLLKEGRQLIDGDEYHRRIETGDAGPSPGPVNPGESVFSGAP